MDCPLPRITWMKTVLNDLESHNLTLTEAVSMAHNRLLWLRKVLYTLLVMEARNDDDTVSNCGFGWFYKKMQILV